MALTANTVQRALTVNTVPHGPDSEYCPEGPAANTVQTALTANTVQRALTASTVQRALTVNTVPHGPDSEYCPEGPAANTVQRALTANIVQRVLKQGLLLPLHFCFSLSYVNCFPLNGLLFTNEDGREGSCKILESLYHTTEYHIPADGNFIISPMRIPYLKKCTVISTNAFQFLYP